VDYSSLPADPRELEDKLKRFKDAARVGYTKEILPKYMCLLLTGW